MMYRTLTDQNRWMTFVIGMLAICTLFTLGAAGQAKTDKPLPAASRANLIAELKEVVSKSVLDDAKTAAVSQKWNERKDLAGKTKAKIIDMLWADAKSVIEDAGVRYQIYSIFAFYKGIPDQNFARKTTKGAASATKPAAVNKLVDLTFQMHPYVGIEEQLAMLPGTHNVKTEAEEDRKNRISGFDDALKVNQKLNEDQKSFVRANYDKMITMSDQITETAIRTNFPTERWIKEGLAKNYTSAFSLKELNDLNAYFHDAPGQQFLKYVRLTHMAQMITGNGGTVDLTDADKAEHDRFVATAAGKKFEKAYMHDTIAYEEAKENAVRASMPNADGFAIYEAANLNKLFNKFVAENYKR
jgi:hypothetical protein